MTGRREVTENELEDLNQTIVYNYELIAEGIKDANRKKANEMYKAAVVLKEYTDDLKNDNCKKVAAYADDAITFIMKLYGADDSNGYTPTRPLTITVREFPYLLQTSTIYGTELSIDKPVTEFKGADSSRNISVYQDPHDSKWYVFSDSYKGLLADIKAPVR